MINHGEQKQRFFDHVFGPQDDFRRIRRALGLGQAELAKILDVAETTVRSWERQGSPKLAMLALECLRRRMDDKQALRPFALEEQIAALDQAANIIHSVARNLRG